jgi:thiazole synthase
MSETVREQSICVRINGEERPVAAGLSIAAMLEAIGIDARKVAVERNLEIVPRSTLAQVAVNDGDAFEIVHFVGGG